MRAANQIETSTIVELEGDKKKRKKETWRMDESRDNVIEAFEVESRGGAELFISKSWRRACT